MPLGDIVIVDIDANTLESPFDDLAELPEDIISDVKHVLKKQSSCYGETVARAFVMAFIAMIGDYKEGFAVKTTEIEINVSFVLNKLISGYGQCLLILIILKMACIYIVSIMIYYDLFLSRVKLKGRKNLFLILIRTFPIDWFL